MAFKRYFCVKNIIFNPLPISRLRPTFADHFILLYIHVYVRIYIYLISFYCFSIYIYCFFFCFCLLTEVWLAVKFVCKCVFLLQLRYAPPSYVALRYILCFICLGRRDSVSVYSYICILGWVKNRMFFFVSHSEKLVDRRL